ncbi:hypothetical protein AB6B38_10915 [Glycocaulis abyssi]|uniref:Uncharacterized protein n=1 Tax=Glycocaulis abyssi TaxID=1433403 RepID=A0ABV9NG89_9PROT
MAILPTAHATQRFGSRAIDFYVAPGQVIGSDPRARADERRIQDLDGERHPVRIGKRDFALDAGDYAAVIRMQPGPKRRSSPVAVVNYRTNSWTRTSQDNTRVLSRAGVSRNANWILTMVVMAALAVLIVWPQLLAVLGLFAPALAAGLPAFDIFAALVSVQPGLADARLTETVPGVAESLGALAPQLSGQEGAAIFAGIVAAGALLAFAARSWRFAWVPVFLVLTLAGAIAINGPEMAAIPALLALAGSAALFIVAGMVNRWRDAARLEARIARLADHVLRHPPQEMVTRRETPAELSDAAGTQAEAETAEDEEAQGVPAAAVAAPVAAVAAAAISARAADGQSEESAIADGSEEEAGELPEAEASAPSEGTSEMAAPEAEAAGEDAAHDPRAEARSMDIAPPPPMPSEALSGDASAERVNRDAEGVDAGSGAGVEAGADANTEADAEAEAEAGPVVTETETLQPEAPVEAAGIVQPETEGDDTRLSSETEAQADTDTPEDAAIEADDAFVSEDAGGETGERPREG